MVNIDGIKNCDLEGSVAEKISSIATQRGMSMAQILLNANKERLDEYLVLPATYDVSGKAFEDYAKIRLEKYLPFIDPAEYLKNPIVEPARFECDIVVTYHRKDPVFFELNDKRHYMPVDKGDTYEELLHRIARDFAKKTLIEAAGYKFVEVPVIRKSENEILADIMKEL